jgi:hypothetical protein
VLAKPATSVTMVMARRAAAPRVRVIRAKQGS